MAINLARLGSVSRSQEPDETVIDLLDKGRDSEQKRRLAKAMDLRQAAQEQRELDDWTLKHDEALRQKDEEEGTRKVMGDYIRDRDFAGSAPIGVVNPKYLNPPVSGPMNPNAPRDTSSLVNETTMNLSKLNPETAEKFRLGVRDESRGDFDRQRKIEGEDRTVKNAASKEAFDEDYKNRELAERGRNDAASRYLQKLGITTAAQTAKDKAAQKKQLTGMARNTALANKVNVGIAEKQLANVRNAFEKVKGRMGPIKSILARAKSSGFLDEDFANYQKAIDALKTTVRKITRTPGEGSMSDWEGRLAQAQLPGINEYPGTAEQAMNQVQDLISGMNDVYGGYDLGDSPATPQAHASGLTPQEEAEMRELEAAERGNNGS